MSGVPLYLFTGPELGTKNDAIQEIKRDFEKKQGTIDFYSFYANDTDFSEIISVLENESLFADARFVVLRNADLLKKKEDLEILSAWISKAENSNSCLILVSDETAVDKKLENLIPKDNKKIFWEMFENQKEEWLRNLFQKQGFKIEKDAVESILELVENNTNTLRNECARFFYCFEKGHTVTEDDVEKLLAHNREETPFSLFESMTDKKLSIAQRLEESLSILQKIRLSKDSSSVQIIAGLTFCFRKLVIWINLFNTGKNSDFDLKINGFSSKKMKTQYSNAQQIWTKKDATRILALLSETDMNIRSSGNTFEDIYMQMLIYNIIAKNGQQLAKAEY